MAKKRGKPEPVSREEVTARVERGPRDDGRWYWRARKGQKTLWCGWGTRNEIETAVRKGKFGPEFATMADVFGAFSASYVARLDVAPGTVRAVSATIANLREGIGNREPESLTRRDLERWRDARLAAGSAGSTVARDLRILAQVWRWAVDCGYLAGDLPNVTVRRSERVYTDYTPTEEELAGILGRAPREWVRRAIVLLRATGARVGEISALRWTAFSEGFVTVSGKTGTRPIPLHPEVWDEVHSWTRDSERVLNVAPITAETELRVYLARVSEEMGLAGRVSPHGIRRAAVDALYRRGTRPEVAAKILGHSPQTALAHYRRVTKDEMLDAVTSAQLGVNR